MALDGIVIRGLVHELQTYAGGRINKIHQPNKNDLLLHIRAQGKNQKLLLSGNPTYPRVHVTEESYVNPLEPPMFCMLMRKYCENGIIESIKQVGNERIIHINVRHRDELGDEAIRTIIIEIMGRHSNVILVNMDNQVIIDGMHHVTPAISTYRTVMPGSPYTSPPEQGKQNPIDWLRNHGQISDWKALFEQETLLGLPPEQQLVKCFEGLSPLVAKEIVHRRSLHDSSSSERAGIYHSFVEMFDKITANHYTPVIKHSTDHKSYFSVVELSHITGEEEKPPTVSAMLDAYFSKKAERDEVKQKVSDLTKHMQNEKHKNEKKLEKLQQTLEQSYEADQKRVLGELLTANMYQIQRGDDFIEAVNYYDETQGTVRIPLDPQLSPSENAQRYFKQYTKLKNSAKAVTIQLKQTEEELRYLDTVLQQLESAGLSDIDDIRDELIEQGYVRERNKTKKRKKSNRPALHCYTSSEGVPIYVGKNNMQNDYLTNRYARATDTWLHTKNIPGSHVVIYAEHFGEATLEEAAQLAAYFSKAGASSQVPVDYTFIRHVRKPSGAKPGFVIYDHQKTLYITPDEKRIGALPHSVIA